MAETDTIMIQKTTLEFLDDLMRNNHREWFAENRPRYEAAKQNVVETAAQMIDLINKFDPTYGYPDPKRALFRINRDTRFSKNKDPYKNHFGMAFSSQGVANSSDSSYYMHIENGSAILATGLFMPTTEHLRDVRFAIETNWDEFQGIIKAPEFIKTFGDLCRESKILKRSPKGFSEDSPAIEYLRFCSFYVLKNISDEEMLSKNFCEKAAKIFEIATPLHKFLNKAITHE